MTAPTTDERGAGHAPEEAITEVLADSHVALRVEVATVMIPTRVWANVDIGDVIATGVDLNEAVVLRVLGVPVGRGVLCVVDGKIGFRVIEKGTGATS